MLHDAGRATITRVRRSVPHGAVARLTGIRRGAVSGCRRFAELLSGSPVTASETITVTDKRGRMQALSFGHKTAAIAFIVVLAVRRSRLSRPSCG
jgi:hypothetical protein